MLTAETLRGVYSAIVTPFKSDESIDEQALRKQTEYVVENGCHAIMSTGGTGEFPHMSREERKEATAIIVDQTGGRIPVIAGTAGCSTREAICLAQDAQEVGASAAILTPTYYFKIPESGLNQHFSDVAGAVDIPVVIYNNPLYTGNPMSPQLMADIMQHPNIIGGKLSQNDMGQLVETIRLTSGQVSVNTGIDSQFYPALCVGSRGIFSTASCVIPRAMVDIYDHFMAGRHEQARVLHMKVQVLNRFLEYDPGYVAPAKEALAMLGIPCGAPRKPLPNLTPEEREGVKNALKQLKML
ncbi:MAG: 4-hydroxy-tetrahydrodipicolinate synthase [Deltaproteobacteria bacterium]|nr:4-hydroxy-tetrahydrodipicolinate synthase [Deltaproteobacteria bacterium]MCH7912045.1 4-hydroxy-tetrahydrodipicolinate synthase [Deltaproteobacteria bacterium]